MPAVDPHFQAAELVTTVIQLMTITGSDHEAKVLVTTSNIKPDLLTTVLKLFTTTGPDHNAEVLVGKVSNMILA